jgi:hypothetical protein
MRMQFIVLGLGAALAACAPPETAPPSPPSPVSSMAPGQYRTTVTYAPDSTGADAPVMSTEQCVTTAEISDLVRGVVASDETASCSENTINTTQDRIEGRVVCLDAQGSSRTMEISGTYGNSRADLDLSVTASENGVRATRQGSVVIERIGECR